MRTLRTLTQLGFLLLTLGAVFVVRGDAERWCPFGGVEALYTYFAEGNMPCSLGVSNFYILAAVLLMTLLLKRAFCSYACPIGTISEWLGRGAAGIGGRSVRVPPRLDRWLGLLKYVALVTILLATYRAGELLFRGYDPCYALLSRHGEDITFWAYTVAGAIVLASPFVAVPFCRWLCPLAAVLQPFSRVGLMRIRRNPDACADCGQCARACPMAVPVDEETEITASSCTACMECVDACPAEKQGALTWGPPAAPRRAWPRSILVPMLLTCIAAAVAASYLMPMPSFTYQRGDAPEVTRIVELDIAGLSCRGRASLLVFFLDRDDEYAVPGYLKLEAWPGPGTGRTRITCDPGRTGEAVIKRAVTEPYFNLADGMWRASPFDIEGYDPFGDPDDHGN